MKLAVTRNFFFLLGLKTIHLLGCLRGTLVVL